MIRLRLGLGLGLAWASLACLARFEVGDAGAGEAQSGTDAEASAGDTASTSGAESGSADAGCDPDELACDGACVDPLTDPAHCGVCGHDCEAGESCELGSCVEACAPACDPIVEHCVGGECACREGFAACGGECVDLRSDPQHCGGCTTDCELAVCQEGDCVSECEEERVDCDGACVDLDRDPLHCGDCSTACGGDELCLQGECYAYDPSDCETDLDCVVGVCCEIDENDKICLYGDQCP